MKLQDKGPGRVLLKYFLAIPAIFFAGIPGCVHSAVWNNELGVGLGFGYVDNIALEQPGSEESEYVLQVTPFIRLNAEGGRLDFDVIYRMQVVNYAESENENTIYHQLFSELNTELLEQFFFLDLRATNTQSAILANASIPQDNISITDNRTNITTTTISPYINARILSETELLLRYTYTKTKYDDIGLFEPVIDNQSVIAELSSVDSPVDWRLGYLRNEFNTNIVEGNYYEDASVTLRYNLVPQLVPFTTIGNEKNRIANSTFDSGGMYWDIGLFWQPTPRTNTSAAYGERFYGTAYAFTWTTRRRRTQINVSYAETVTNAGAVFAGQPSPDSAPPGGNDEFVPISIRPFLRKRIESNFNYNYSKTNLNWYLYREHRTFLTGAPDEEYNYGTTLSWFWRLTGRTRPAVSIGWQRIQVETPGYEDNRLWNINLGITHITSERIRTSINYRYLEQESTNIINNYRQNMISAGIVILFAE